MAYADFTIDSLKSTFGLRFSEHPDLFAGVAELQPSGWLQTMLAESVPLARAMNTEKARSELIIAPVLAEMRIRFPERCSLFSGAELNVDPERGLRGYCDFILSRSPFQHALSEPLVMIAEAKNLDMNAGLGQSVAGMLGARLFNEQKHADLPVLFGVVSNGQSWEFLKMEGSAVVVDMRVYDIEHVAKILGVLKKMIMD